MMGTYGGQLYKRVHFHISDIDLHGADLNIHHPSVDDNIPTRGDVDDSVARRHCGCGLYDDGGPV